MAPGSIALALICPCYLPLIRNCPDIALVLGVTQQDPSLVPRPQDQGTWKILDYIQTARISLQGDFDSYWKTRGKNLRQNMRTQRNRLEKNVVTTLLQVNTKLEEAE